jgi:glycolate oxidase FAD binding subunit
MTIDERDDSRTLQPVPGVRVHDMIQVETSDRLADVLATATSERHPVIPMGGKLSVGTGNVYEPARWGLDLTPMEGIIAYEAADLTLSVRAGTRISEIMSELAASGQELPIDVPFPETTTIGGLVASGFAGPRRLRSGTLRDLLIGCEFVRGDGLLARAGGMVVKNVSGFEIPRFLHGSWGGLAVISSVNLKVTPRPRADGTLLARYELLDDAISAAQALISGEASIDACTVTLGRDGVVLAARATGRPGAVDAMLSGFGQAVQVDSSRIQGEASIAYWQNLVNQWAENQSRVVVAVSVRPREIGEVVSALNSVLGNGFAIMVSPGLGSARVAIEDDEYTASALPSILDVISGHNASYVIESASPGLRATWSTWGAEPEGIDLMRSVKRQFDPADVLNRGRLFL